MVVSMVTVEGCSKFDEILKETNLNEFGLVDYPEERDMSEVLLGIISAHTVDTKYVWDGTP